VQSPKCQIAVTLLDDTNSDDHKFKVHGREVLTTAPESTCCPGAGPQNRPRANPACKPACWLLSHCPPAFQALLDPRPSPSRHPHPQISGIMMNEYTGSDVTTKIHEEKWLGDLQATSGRRRRSLQAMLGYGLL
jgi:hypothetical protein